MFRFGPGFADVGFRIWGLGFRVEVWGLGLGFRVEVWGLGLRVEDLEFRGQLPGRHFLCSTLSSVATCVRPLGCIGLFQHSNIHEIILVFAGNEEELKLENCPNPLHSTYYLEVHAA